MELEERFGEVRSLLNQPPSRASFDLICQHIDAAAADDTARVSTEWLPHIGGALDSWPASARICPANKLREFEDDKVLWGVLVRGLDYANSNLTKKRATSLLSSSHLPQLEWFDLRASTIKWEQLGQLAGSTALKLGHFGFRRSGKIDEDILRALLSSEPLSELDSLSLRGWEKMKPVVIDHIIELLPLSKITALDLSGGVLSNKRIDQLLREGELGGLTSLRVEACGSTKNRTGCLDVLTRHAHLRALSELYIAGGKDQEFDEFSNATHLHQLDVLEIGSPIKASGCAALAKTPLPRLRRLRINLDPVDPLSSMRELIAAPWLEDLESLSIGWYTKDGSSTDCLELLTTSHTFPKLRSLDVTLNHDKDVALLANSSQLTDELTHLGVVGMGRDLREDTARALFNSSKLSNLTSLRFGTARPANSTLADILATSTLLPRLSHLTVHARALMKLGELIESDAFRSIRALSIPELYSTKGDVFAALCRALGPGSTAELETIELGFRRELDELARMLDTADAPSAPLHLTCREYN